MTTTRTQTSDSSRASSTSSNFTVSNPSRANSTSSNRARSSNRASSTSSNFTVSNPSRASSSRANSAQPSNKADASANKINSWVVVSAIFFNIGIIAISIAGLGFNHILIQASIHTLEFTLGAGVISTATAIISFVVAFMSEKSSNAPITSSSLTRGGSTALSFFPQQSSSSINGVVGISNSQNNRLLNNCALNSLLQILLHCQKIKEYLKQIEVFQTFIRDYDSFREGDKITAQSIRQYLASKKIMQEGAEPEDVNSILEFILKELSSKAEDMKNTLFTTNHYEYNVDERKSSTTEEDNYGIIPLPVNSSDEDLTTKLLNYFLSEQNIDATTDEDTIHLTKEEQNELSLKQSRIEEPRTLVYEERKLKFAPENLFLHIQRSFKNKTAPIKRLPKDLHLEEQYFQNNQSENYELKGFIVHIHNAHYYSYVKKDNKWYKCDDSRVEEVTENTALGATIRACVVHYEKRKN